MHHIHHWGELGPTNVDNTLKLCKFHHRGEHAGLFTIERLGSNGERLSTQSKAHIKTLVFKTRKGKVMEQNPHLPKCDSAKEFFQQQWPNINMKTATSKWLGEIMDYGMAVEGLLQKRKVPYRFC